MLKLTLIFFLATFTYFSHNALASSQLLCDNISFPECVKKISDHYKVTVTTSENIKIDNVHVLLSGTSVNDDISTLLNSTNLNKFVITKHETTNAIHVTIFLSPNEEKNNHSLQDESPKKSAKTSSKEDSFPSAEDIEAQKEKIKSPQPIDLDAKISIPGFPDSEGITLRQIRSNQERYAPKPDDLVIPGLPKEENTTYKELENIRIEINKAPDLDQPFTMPDGSVVIPREIKEADKLNKPAGPEMPADKE